MNQLTWAESLNLDDSNRSLFDFVTLANERQKTPR